MADRRRAILFACNMNSVRSPMAEALAKAILGPDVHVESCGVYDGYMDPFVAMVLEEDGIAPPSREPQTFAKVDPGKFDEVVALTPEAAAEARRAGAKVTFWEVPNPTDVRGGDNEMLLAYRGCRDDLKKRIEEAFAG